MLQASTLSRAVIVNSLTLLRRCSLLVIMALGVAFAPRVTGAMPPVTSLQLGYSSAGRPINGVRIGSGPHTLWLIGNTHGGPEANTYELVRQLADHFAAHPDEVPSAVSLFIVPTVNPDGLALGVRQNALGVDLNRNFDTSADPCPDNDWRQVVQGAYGIESPTGGPYADSETETRLVRDLLMAAEGAILFHSNAGVVFPACDHLPSVEMARVFATGAAYTFIPRWDRYTITGGMHDWAGGMGIAAITPELVSGDLPEFPQNLAGVRAVLGSYRELLFAPPKREVAGIPIEPVVWRSWRSWGGEALFGPPLAPPVRTTDGWTQLFRNARFEYRPALNGSAQVVQLARLGADEQRAPDSVANSPSRPEPPTPASPFATYWQVNGALPVFGLALSAWFTTTLPSGATVVEQPFERAILQATDGVVAPLPLGRRVWARVDALNPLVAVRAR